MSVGGNVYPNFLRLIIMKLSLIHCGIHDAWQKTSDYVLSGGEVACLH